MSNRLTQLAKRRAELINRCEAQRQELADHELRLQKPIAAANFGWRVARWVRERPALFAAATLVTTLVVGKKLPRKTRWIKGVFALAQFGRSISQLKNGLGSIRTTSHKNK